MTVVQKELVIVSGRKEPLLLSVHYIWYSAQAPGLTVPVRFYECRLGKLVLQIEFLNGAVF